MAFFIFYFMFLAPVKESQFKPNIHFLIAIVSCSVKTGVERYNSYEDINSFSLSDYSADCAESE